MRAVVWWCLAALLLVAATSALRTPQVESMRHSRRLSSSYDSRGSTSTEKTEDAIPTFRSRSHKRREEPTSSTPRDVVRSRSRNKVTDTLTSNIVTEQPTQTKSGRNEGFDSRRTNRIRSRPIENESKASTSSPSRENSVRNKARQSNRRGQHSITEASLLTTTAVIEDVSVKDINSRRTRTTSTEIPLKLSSPAFDDLKTEVTSNNFDDFTRIVPKEEDVAAVQIKRRSSTARTVESETVTPKAIRSRGRVNTRTNIKLEDMASSGATNTLTIAENNPINDGVLDDTRKSRKLRYRTRLSESETNLTGEGMSNSNEIIKSVKKKQKLSSQTENRTDSGVSIDNNVEKSTTRSTSKTSVKSMRVVRRPLSRGKENATASSKIKTSDEIRDDDNYPEPFKALIQAKNASTQESSPSSESLSVKATHKVINTYTQTTLPPNTSPESNYSSRLRSKLNITEKVSQKEDVTVTPNLETSKSNSQEYRLRGKYSPRSRKFNSVNSDISQKTTTSGPATVKSTYKFTRKLRTTTTESPPSNISPKTKRFELGQASQKTAVRSPYHSRNNVVKNNFNSSEESSSNARPKIDGTVGNVSNRVKLPRTSYYTRLRKNLKNDVTSTTGTQNVQADQTQIANKKMENTADVPLIYTLLSKDNKNIINNNAKNNDKDEFLIAASSKESQENNVNEIVANAEESENKQVESVFSTTQKYHANYKDQALLNESPKVDFVVTTATPSIRNIQTRKYARKLVKSKLDATSTNPVLKSKERNLRKYSDTFSKTTEASTNGITSDPEKPKSRFSSKYRASHLDKPFYKPTVPTVTPTTAWLKFFVTEHHLTKSMKDPKWFEDNDFYDVATESISRQKVTTTSFIHDSSSELVEGEEIQLGPDMNAISFTQTRNTLSSADLKLSESLVKPSHIMNVEASNHSPSVTVSIFDALAEILTSTPRIQISSTTEVPQQIFTNSVTEQTLITVSSNNNVNNVIDLSSQGTSMSTDSITTNIPVQITDQTTPNVLNRLSVEENVSPSVKITEEMAILTTSTPTTTLAPTPTTPLSARRPFAIKVLYSDTERPTDIIMTSSEPTTKWSTTENPKTVYNTVSDLLLSNNKLVSSELTSMLTNNINNIMRNLDEDSRSKISVDMVNLLNTLIPKAMIKLPISDVDNILNTTPYSLEDIKDTENVDIGDISINNNNTSSISQNINLLQNLVESDVNTEQNTTDSSISEVVTEQVVNSTIVSPSIYSTTNSVLESVATVADIATTIDFDTVTSPRTFELSTSSPEITSLITPGISIEELDTATLPNLGLGTASVDSTQVETFSIPVTDPTNKPLPLPVFTNANIEDFASSRSGNFSSLISKSGSQVQDIDNIDIDDPSQISRLQLWVLSKKARILKMIEQLIREHNEELANAPLTDLLDESNNITVSNRLTDLNSTMNFTTSTDRNIDIISTTINPDFDTVFTNSNSPPELPESSTIDILNNRFGTDITTPLTNIENDVSILPITTEVVSTTDANEIETTSLATNVEAIDETVTEQSIENQDVAEGRFIATENEENSTNFNTETTLMNDLETSTETSVTTESIVETTTQAGIETTTVTLVNETKSQDVITISTQLNFATQPVIPKKDYVIFGILPNNTVVRKDPNDNVLEKITEASPYIVYGVLPNNTVIRKFPNGTRVPRVMQKIDVLPISPWSLRNPYSPIHNNPAIVRPQSNPIRVSTNIVTSTNNEKENRLTTVTVNNQQMMISSSALNLKDSSSFGITTATTKPSAEKSTASHVLSLRTTTMLPSIHEILLNSLSSATKEEMVISSMTSSTREPRILTLDIDPETKQIRTEKPDNGKGNTVFKFIPIDQVTVSQQDTNVLKLASTKTPPKINTMKPIQIVTPMPVTEINLQTPQIQTRLEAIDEPTTTPKSTVVTRNEKVADVNNDQFTISTLTTSTTTSEPTTESMTSTISMTEESINMLTTVKDATTVTTSTDNSDKETFTTSTPSSTPLITTTDFSKMSVTISSRTNPALEQLSTSIATSTLNDINVNLDTSSTQVSEESLSSSDKLLPTVNKGNLSNQENIDLLQNLLAILSTTVKPKTFKESDQMELLQAILLATGQNQIGTNKVSTTAQPTTLRSIQDEIRQFEEDTKLLKALLQVTGQNPPELKIPTVVDIKPKLPAPLSTNPTTTTVPTTTMAQSTPLQTIMTTTPSTTSVPDSVTKIIDETQLLQALLQATDQNADNRNMPVISGITSNVRIASNPLTTSVESNPTTPISIRPIYTTLQPTESALTQTNIPQTTAVLTTLQGKISAVTESGGISTTYKPIDNRAPKIIISSEMLPSLSARRVPDLAQVSTEVPSTSTFSVEEDLEFLNNLKTVLNTNNNNDDYEAALANRVIALAVERSLKEIQTGKQTNGKQINVGSNTNEQVLITTKRPTTTTTGRPTTTTRRPTTTTTRMTTTTAKPLSVRTQVTPSLEEDIKQFEEDTKLLQALLKATGQDSSKFNIPTLPNVNVSPKNIPVINEDLNILTNLLAKPSPLNEPFDSLTQNSLKNNQVKGVTASNPSTTKPFIGKIAVKDDLKNVQDDAQLLQTLIKLKDAQETTTQRNKIAITGQSSDEALKKLIQQAKPAAMVSEATKPSVSLSTEYGNSNDALLAALLKEQGFGPTTASSLDEQIRLAALLNQVVVTPKARRTTTLPPPPPAPRRPILDGLAWLWQQWRDTAPGTGGNGDGTRTSNRRPAPTARPTVPPSVAAPSRVNWFGSGPFVGNADDRPSSNRIPLEPPRVVAAEQTPGGGQLVSAAINVTRAFSQFLGAAIQGAAKTVQNVIRAGQKAATDVYTNGSG